jgi:hypothetical protein
MFTAQKMLITVTLVASLLGNAASASADGKPCYQGLKGGYVTWSKSTSQAGVGVFSFPSGRAAVLPSFSWDVSGMPESIKVGRDEPFSGGNSMKGFYGQADDATNLNVRVQGNETASRQPIPHNATLTIRFNAGTPASGWGFAVIDIDVDQVLITAKDTAGNLIPTATVAKWFIQKFDANPSQDGVNIPSWDAASTTVVGSESSSTKRRTTVEGNLVDTEAASAWFQPNASLSELVFTYESLQEDATPSYHVLIGSCATTYIAPTPTPAASGDSDGDTIPDSNEGSGDPDNDDRPNYLDKDSDGDTIPDSIEGTTDTDGDGSSDYLDEDSDGDGISDEIERGPESTDNSSGSDTNRDGIDDGDSSRATDPLSDSDGDGTPDSKDEDSDNDGKPDTQEAFDLDGDGTPDVTPSGEDSNDNGLDDAYETFNASGDLNRSYVGDNGAPCTSVSIAAKKAAIRARLAALADRVPSFAKKARACGAAYPTSLVRSGAAARKALAELLNREFQDTELQCPASVCPTVSTKTTRAALAAYAKVVYAYAKRSKNLAQRACKVAPSAKPDPRPRTEVYLSRLQGALAKLPKTQTSCE